MRRDSQKTNIFRPVFFYFTDAQTSGNRCRSSGTKKPVLSGLDFSFHGVISQKRISGKKTCFHGLSWGLFSQGWVDPHFDIQRLLHGVSHKTLSSRRNDRSI